MAPRRDDPDDARLFLQEMNEAGQGMNNADLGRIYIEEIHDRIAELPGLGIEPRLMEQNRVACFARRERALYFWEDWDGTRRRVRDRLSAWQPPCTIATPKPSTNMCHSCCIKKPKTAMSA